MPQITLMSRLTHDETVQVGVIQVGGKSYPNNVVVPARGKVENVQVDKIKSLNLPQGITRIGGGK